MTTILQTTSTSTTITLLADEWLYVAPNVVVATQTYGVLANVATNIENNGAIFGVEGGIRVTAAATVVNGAAGVISGGELSFAAIDVQGTGTITNLGHIQGNAFNGFGVAMGGAGELQNFGTISGRNGVTNYSGAGTFLFRNHGTVTGTDKSYYGQGSAHEIVVNSGIMQGDVLLGDGFESSFDSSLGLVFGTIFGGADTNVITGGRDNNLILGRGGDDTLHGGGGDDTIRGENGSDSVFGDDGNDTVYVDSTDGIDALDGGAGVDVLYFNRFNSALGLTFSIANPDLGQEVEDGSTIVNFERLVFTGGNGNDSVTGGLLADQMIGSDGNDVLNGGGGRDTLQGDGGNDSYVADVVNERIIETDSSVLTGGNDLVTYVGSSGTFTLGDNLERLTLGGTGAIGGTGNALNNTIKGNAAGNVIAGGLGNDTLTGGLGKDFFVFNTLPNTTTNSDTITDFKVVDDTIRLENTGIFTALGLATGTLNATLFKNLNLAAADANDRILYNDTTGAIYYDIDGSGATAGIKIATITGAPTLTNADFVVI